MNQKLNEIANSIDIQERDLRMIRRRKLLNLLLYPAVAISSAIVGLILSIQMTGGFNRGGYPYAIAMASAPMIVRKRGVTPLLVLSVVLFFMSFLYGLMYFGIQTLYNVYYRTNDLA